MPNKKLIEEHKTYINKWKNNAEAFNAQKCYSWMAKKILTSQKNLILDIGCGDGTGLVALLSENSNNQLKIIAIDENLDCLKEAERKLSSKGYSTELIKRCDIIYDNKYHGYNFKSIDKIPEQQITLIHSDLVSDPYIEPYLKTVGKFDAITIWLIGTHTERRHCMNIFPLNITSDAQYRLLVQNKAYELADEILISGGILQTVDRGQVPNTELLKDEVINAHKDQASVTTLEVFDLDFMIYNEPINKSSVQMKTSVGSVSCENSLSELAMTSILARK
ncbi:class I SAM-dependent methyltransferase [Arcobacter sp. F2176]|uniref:class I SAM-dependent methyltransferase n=1 Tax=Arcobacter sp. F2176 TaxID=2044511 RepID=UPI00100BB43C|nr:class I SAM-dependent methyltransferase [Arcobacter sp. F2176]RXJ79279.1 hypothetical protein CRU95_14850 [Arcobacter sp. F2176]